MASPPPTDIPALVAKLNLDNGVDALRKPIRELIIALRDQDDRPDVASEIARSGGIQAAIDLMKQCPDFMHVQGFGSLVLRATAAVNEGYKREIYENGGIERLLFVLSNFPDDDLPRQQALRALGLLTETSPTSVADGIPVILKAMERHMDDIETQRIACGLFLELLEESDVDAKDAVCVSLADAGCIPIFVTSLESCVEVASNQGFLTQDEMTDGNEVHAFSILLSINRILRRVETSKHEFADAGGFQAVVGAMRQWKDTDTIQGLACEVLHMMRDCSEQDKAAVVEAGGIGVVLAATELFMRTTTTSDEALSHKLGTAMLALGAFSKNNSDAVTTIHKAGGFQIMIDVLQEPLLNAALDEKSKLDTVAILLLWSYVNTLIEEDIVAATDLLFELIGFGVTSTILLSMQQFPNHVKLQFAGCLFLKTISMVDKGATSVVVDGGREIIEEAKVAHANDENIQEFASEALESIEWVEDLDRCHWCHTSSDDLMRCSRCRKVLYCNRDCQREDYKVHKKLCKQMVRASGGSARSSDGDSLS